MKVTKLKTTIATDHSGYWEWQILIWTLESRSADLVIKSTTYFLTEEYAEKNMNEIIEQLGLHS